MPLKLTVNDLSELPEAQRSLYRQRDEGGFILDVEGGVVAKSALEGFRGTNIELTNKLKALGDLTPDQVKQLRDTNAQLTADLESARKGKDKDVEARINALTDGHTKALGDLTKERDGLKGRLEAVLIDGEVQRVAASLGALPAALADITARVRPTLRVGDDNAPYQVDAKGEKIYGSDGRLIGVDGAVRRLVKEASHLFKPSSGGGAAGQPAGGGRSHNTTGNPWSKEHWNVTEQMKAQKADPQEASRLAAEAGQKL